MTLLRVLSECSSVDGVVEELQCNSNSKAFFSFFLYPLPYSWHI